MSENLNTPYVYNIPEAVFARIRSYDRQRVRERFDCARRKFEMAELSRRREAVCYFITGWKSVDTLPPDISVPDRCRYTAKACRKPSVFVEYDDAPYLCEEHYAIAKNGNDLAGMGLIFSMSEVEQAGSPTRIIETGYGGAVKIIANYGVPELVELLIPFIILHIIGDEQLYLGGIKNHALREDAPTDYPDYEERTIVPVVWPRIDYAAELMDEPIIVGLPLSLQEYQECLLSESLITDDDLTWIKKAALRAKKFFRDIDELLQESVALMCNQAVLYSLDRPISEEQSAKLLRGIGTASPRTRWYAVDRAPH